MNTLKRLMIFILVLSVASVAKQAASRINSDASIKKQIIEESISQYPGSCPCPYNSARNGSRCGKRSAYSRGGGYAPLCFDSDVTEEMIDAWRNSHAIDTTTAH